MAWSHFQPTSSNAFEGLWAWQAGTWVAFLPIVAFPLLTVVLLLSGAAQSAPSVGDAQAALAQAQADAARLTASRQAVQAQLDELGATIAEKKKALPAGAEPGAELTRLLQDSTRLAAQLAELERQVADAATRTREAADGLTQSCDRELGGLQSRWAAAPAGERMALEGRIAEVGKSCNGRSLGQADRPVGGSSVPASALGASATDDPQSLQQKADFLHDREDVLRRRIAQMSQRIGALERERSLARRVSEFVKEQDLFDENDTRITASRTELTAAPGPQSNQAGGAASVFAPQSPSAGNNGASDTASRGGGAGTTPTTGTGNVSGGAGGQNGAAPTGLGSVAAPADAPSGSEGSQGSRQTYVGARPEELRTGDDAAGDNDSLEGLQAERTALEQEAQKLHQAATALEHTATERR
jgi:hypothetical protein